jgi:hypothetical protein
VDADGVVMKGIGNRQVGDSVTVMFADGSLDAEVRSVILNGNLSS